MSIAEVLLYDSGSSYSDKEFCLATLGSANNYDDLLEYTLVSGSRTYRYAYFVRTWQSAINLSGSSAVGWDLSYLKCKFYAQTWTAYFFFSDSSIEIANNAFTASDGDSLATTGISSPLNKYFDQTFRVSNGTDTYFTV